MLVRPGIEVKAVVGHAAPADRDLGQHRPDFGLEEVLAHAEVAWGIALPNEAGKQNVTHLFCA